MANGNSLVEHGAHVLVADGRTARLLRNEGNPFAPKLIQVQEFSNPERGSTRELGADRPGRSFSSVGGGRSSVEQTDWHDQAERRFAAHVAAALDKMRLDRKIKALAIVAAPRTLAVLREAMPEGMRAIVVVEIDKDLTKRAIKDVEQLLAV
jgi:protein required for attachment to host cells